MLQQKEYKIPFDDKNDPKLPFPNTSKKDIFAQTTSRFLPIYPFHLYCEEPRDLIINRLNTILFFDQNLPTSF